MHVVTQRRTQAPLRLRSRNRRLDLFDEHPRVEVLMWLQLVLLFGDGLGLFSVVSHVVELDPTCVGAQHANDAVPVLWDEDAVVVRVGHADHHLVVLLDRPERQCLERQVGLVEQRHLCRGGSTQSGEWQDELDVRCGGRTGSVRGAPNTFLAFLAFFFGAGSGPGSVELRFLGTCEREPPGSWVLAAQLAADAGTGARAPIVLTCGGSLALGGGSSPKMLTRGMGSP